MEELYNKAKKILKKYNQEQLLLKYEDLEEKEKKVLINQILEIDFELMNALYKMAKTDKKENEKEEIIEPVKGIDKEKLTKEECEYYKNIGIKEIKEGKLAAVTMAGRTRNKASDIMDQRGHLC